MLSKLTLLFSVLLLSANSFVFNGAEPPSKDVMIYGIIYFAKCGREDASKYVTKFVAAKNSGKERKIFEIEVKINVKQINLLI